MLEPWLWFGEWFSSCLCLWFRCIWSDLKFTLLCLLLMFFLFLSFLGFDSFLTNKNLVFLCFFASLICFEFWFWFWFFFRVKLVIFGLIYGRIKDFRSTRFGQIRVRCARPCLFFNLFNKGIFGLKVCLENTSLSLFW